MTRDNMATNLRGQLGVKSGPLAPTSAKLTTQMLVVTHMESHYNKISKARPAIDNGPPKSMLASQKLRDRKSRKVIEKYGSRPASRLTYRPASAISNEDIYDERHWEEPEDEDERQVRDIMRTTLRVPLKAQHGIVNSVDATDGGSRSENVNFGTRTMRPQSANSMRGVAQAMRGLSGGGMVGGRPRPASARSTTSLASNFSVASRSSNPLKATYDGDVINKHAHNFTEPAKPFTPRTLKSNRESSLKRYKYYTPPPAKKGGGGNTNNNNNANQDPGVGSSSNHQTKVKVAPQARPRARSAKGGGGGGGGRGGEDLGVTGTLTETMLMDMSLVSHDPRQPSPGGVPRLDISMDKDHMSWVQEQATRAHHRVSNGGSVAEESAADTGGDTLGKTDTLRFTRTGSSAKSFGVKSPTSRRLGQAEEEQKYVTFAHEVTQDILNRGISSDRVLQKVFDSHVDRKKGELDERRLRAIITDIRRDLGVQNVGPLPAAATKSVRYDKDTDPTETSDSELALGTMASSLGNNTTLSATNNTYNFERTTDMFSTIHSQPGEEEEGVGGDLSASQALRQYQMDLTTKDDADDRSMSNDRASMSNDRASVSNSLDHASMSNGIDRPLTAASRDHTPASSAFNDRTPASSLANGADSAEESYHLRESTAAEEDRPAVRPRRLTRQDASTAGQDTPSRRTSVVTDTDARTEEEEEEEVEEEYESDYDADEDDGTPKQSDDDF